jgi:hypothetical protein
MTKASAQYFAILIAVFLICITLSCTKEKNCDQSLISAANISLYVGADAVNVDQLSIIGLNNDSILLNSVNDVHSFSLPLSQLQNNCAFLLQIGTSVEILSFDYTHDLEFISEECGFSSSFTITKFEPTTSTFIDSFEIIDPVVNISETENIKIYLF